MREATHNPCRQKLTKKSGTMSFEFEFFFRLQFHCARLKACGRQSCHHHTHRRRKKKEGRRKKEGRKAPTQLPTAHTLPKLTGQDGPQFFVVNVQLVQHFFECFAGILKKRTRRKEMQQPFGDCGKQFTKHIWIC